MLPLLWSCLLLCETSLYTLLLAGGGWFQLLDAPHRGGEGGVTWASAKKSTYYIRVETASKISARPSSDDAATTGTRALPAILPVTLG